MGSRLCQSRCPPERKDEELFSSTEKERAARDADAHWLCVTAPYSLYVWPRPATGVIIFIVLCEISTLSDWMHRRRNAIYIYYIILSSLIACIQLSAAFASLFAQFGWMRIRWVAKLGLRKCAHQFNVNWWIYIHAITLALGRDTMRNGLVVLVWLRLRRVQWEFASFCVVSSWAHTLHLLRNAHD